MNRITKLHKQEDITQGQVKKKKSRKRQGGLLIPASLLINTQFKHNRNIPKEPTIYPNEQNYIKNYIKKLINTSGCKQKLNKGILLHNRVGHQIKIKEYPTQVEHRIQINEDSVKKACKLLGLSTEYK